MSSANEQLPPPPKPRISPLDFRNTDLVSRLLAATPPYLYNMSLLPNTYFFSEMLRSFVQAKAEQNSRNQATTTQHRRSRKRTWSSARAECFQKQTVPEKAPEKPEPPADWMLRSNNIERRVEENNPLELTINKIENEVEPKAPIGSLFNKPETFTKPETSMNDQIFPSMHPSVSSQDAITNLVLPPPPPMWYPPLYPTAPYGIDPLHFFIDLRVSGHIYDRKNQKDLNVTPSNSNFLLRDKLPSTEEPIEVKNEEEPYLKDIFKQPRHASAFSVPIPSSSKSTPINLSPAENRSTKFDVKSMGFDKGDNRTSTNYIMGNIKDIYRNIEDKREVKDEESMSRGDAESSVEETEEEKQKRVKDLRALIGLELVVDYMNHGRPGDQINRSQSAESVNSTDMESIGSPNVEVVDVHDEA